MNIPQITRDRLASSVVGTPGVDNSAQQISEALNGVVRSGIEVMSKRQNSMDDVEVAKLSTDMVVASQQVLHQHQSAYAADPAGKAEKLDSALNGAFDPISQKASNSRVKMALDQQKAHIRGNRLIDEMDWAYKQENDNTKNRVVQSNQSLATQANVLGMSTMSLEQKLKAHEELLNTAQKNMITAQNAGFDMTDFGVNGLKSINGGFISGLIESDPAVAAKLLDNPKAFFMKDAAGADVDVLGIKEREGYKDAAKKKFEGDVAQAQYEQKLNAAQTHGDIYSKIVQGDATLADINALEQPTNTPEELKNINALRDIYLQAKPFDTKTDSAAYLQFKLKYDSITADLKDKGRKKDKVITNPLNDVIGFDREITDAVAKQFITKEEGKNLRDMMVSPVYEKAKSAKGGFWFGLGQSPWEAGYGAINDSLNKDKSLTGKDKEQRKYEVLQSFVSQFNKLPQKTEVAAKELAQSLVVSDLTNRHPVLATLPQTPNAIMTTNGQVTNTLSGASKLSPEAGVQQPFTIMRDKNGVSARVYKDGHIEELP